MLKQQKLNQSVIKADKAQAERITDELLAQTYPNSDKPIFKKKATDSGWKVYAPMETSEGKKCFCRCFEYQSNKIGSKIYWDERIVEIK